MHGIMYLLGFVGYSLLLIVSLVGIPVFIAHLLLLLIGAEKREKVAKEKIQNSLMEGESLVASGLEKRLFSLFSRRSCIAVTDSRVLHFDRPLLGGFKMVDFQWKDVRDAELSENMLPDWFGANLSIKHSQPKRNVDINVTLELANTIYKYAQKQEQAWEEKNRMRKIEEERAKAGGTYITSPAAESGNSGTEDKKSVMDEIKEAKQMLDENVISDAEFDELKSKILSRSPSQ